MAHQSTHWYLKQVDLFKGISDEEIMKIADKVIERRCRKKELLYTPFEESDMIGILKKGEVTLYYSHNGKKLVIDVLKPGSVFGNISFEKKKSPHFAEVTQDAYMCLFKLEDFLKIAQARPEVMMRLLRMMSGQIHDYEHKLESGLFDSKERVIRYLKAEEEKKNDNILNRLFGRKSRVTHAQIAQQTGLSRETVTRVLSDLKKRKILDM
ncbi:MAG: Crp/Fnr family transcriptional regulator [Candidatus Peregrinibacteria bacterium]|nr:Crp/Fnr family transcriptional regulator [Candidatus Peregrinibacteria bacterium]